MTDPTAHQPSPDTTPAEPTSGVRENRILIFTPVKKDAATVVEILQDAGLDACPCASLTDLATQIDGGCGAIIVAEEALEDQTVAPLATALGKQPLWSEIPVGVLTRTGNSTPIRTRQLAAHERDCNLFPLEYPVGAAGLARTLKAAIHARQRQYRVRDLLTATKPRSDEADAATAPGVRSDFLATVLHTLRTPLNPVLLLASEGARNAGYPAPARTDFDTIARHVTLEARLFEDLLDFTRLTSGKFTLECQPHNLHASLRDALATVENDLRQRQLHLRRDFTGKPLIVSGDSVRLQQIFWNLLKNAVKFTPPGGTISIVTDVTEGKKAMVTISDTGVGLTPLELQRVFNVFEPDEPASAAEAHHPGGPGLSLALSKILVELHGGTLTATSPGRGQGATFTVELPLVHAVVGSVKPTFDHASPANASAPSTEKLLRVLVVEDHEPTRTALTRLLSRRKFEVLNAGSLREARAIAAKNELDLMLSDVGLPDGSGYELMRELAAKGIRGIALTGYGKEEDVALSGEAGFSAHLTKPVDVKSLDKALSEVNSLSATG